MSHDAILSVKLERPHGSMLKGKKALWQQRPRRQPWGESSISLFLSLFLTCQGRWECERREGKKQRCAREGKNRRVK
jgi:hypothetical protein